MDDERDNWESALRRMAEVLYLWHSLADRMTRPAGPVGGMSELSRSLLSTMPPSGAAYMSADDIWRKHENDKLVDAPANVTGRLNELADRGFADKQDRKGYRRTPLGDAFLREFGTPQGGAEGSDSAPSNR